MTNSLLRYLTWLALLPLAAGCAVYRPMQCAAPAIREQGQVELAGSCYFNTRLHGAINYSPVRHLLVRAALDSKADSDDSTYARSLQYELAAGTYWPLSDEVVVGALAGAGQASSHVRYQAPGIFFPSTQYAYEARYTKVFGEVYGTVQLGLDTHFGAAYRFTHVSFNTLTNLGQPLGLTSMLRGEPMFFLRRAFGNSPSGDQPLYVQFGVGATTPLGSRREPFYTPEANLLDSRVYFTFGVGFFPSMLWRH